MAWIQLDENNQYIPGSLHLIGENTIIASLDNQSPTPGFISNLVLFDRLQKTLLSKQPINGLVVNTYPTKYFSIYYVCEEWGSYNLNVLPLSDIKYPQSIGIPNIISFAGVNDFSDFYYSGTGVNTCLVRRNSQLWMYNESDDWRQISNSVLRGINVENIKKIVFSDGNDRLAQQSESSSKGYYILMNDGKIWFLNEIVSQLRTITSPYNSGIVDISWSPNTGIIASKRFVGPPTHCNIYKVNYASSNQMEVLLAPSIVRGQNFYLSDICQNFNGDFYGIVGSDWQNFYTGQLVYWQNENIDISIINYKAQDSAWRAELLANPSEMIKSLGMTTQDIIIEVKELIIGSAIIPEDLEIVLDPILTNDTDQAKNISSRDTFSGDYEFDFLGDGVRFRCTRAILKEIMKQANIVADRIIKNLKQDTINSFIDLFARPDRQFVQIDDFIRRLLHQIRYDHQCYLERIADQRSSQIDHGSGGGGSGGSSEEDSHSSLEIVDVDTVFFRYFEDPDDYGHVDTLYEIRLSNYYLGSFVQQINKTLAFTISHILYNFYRRSGSV